MSRFDSNSAHAVGRPWKLSPAVRRAPLAVATALLVACAKPPPPAPTPAVTLVPPAPPWNRFAELDELVVATVPFRTAHLVEARRAQVRVSKDAAATYGALVVGSTLSVGTLLVEALSADDAAPPELYLVMEKAAEGWQYAELDREGQVVARRTELCQRCHQEALSDELFGPGANALPASPGPEPTHSAATATP